MVVQITTNGDALTAVGTQDFIKRYRKNLVGDDQFTSYFFKHIKASLPLVRSLVRRFDQPQSYKPFVSKCIMQGDLKIGTMRKVNVKLGLPTTTCRERLELLDDEEHIFSMRIVGGDHWLKVDKLKVLSKSLVSLASKAERRISNSSKATEESKMEEVD